MPMRWRCPPDSLLPASPIGVSIPAESDCTKSSSRAARRELLGSPTVDFLLLFAQGDVFQQGAVQQEHVLRNVADGILPAAAVGGGQGLAVDRDFTAGGGYRIPTEG